MPNLNRVLLIGRTTRDPELRYTPKGTAVTELGLAVNRVWTDEAGQKQEETTFIEVTLWSRLAEISAQYLKKGASAFVEGRLHPDSWLNQAGQKQTKLRVVAENLQLLGSRPPAAASREAAQGPREPAVAPFPSQPAPAHHLPNAQRLLSRIWTIFRFDGHGRRSLEAADSVSKDSNDPYQKTKWPSTYK